MHGKKISEREAEALHVPLITADARIQRSGVARCKVEVFDAHT